MVIRYILAIGAAILSTVVFALFYELVLGVLNHKFGGASEAIFPLSYIQDQMLLAGVVVFMMLPIYGIPVYLIAKRLSLIKWYVVPLLAVLPVILLCIVFGNGWIYFTRYSTYFLSAGITFSLIMSCSRST